MTELILGQLHRLRSAARMRLMELRGESGNAIVELALVLSLFGMPLMLGAVQVAGLVYDSIEVSNAAHAAAMYGMWSSAFAGENSDMTTIAQADAADFGSKLTVTPTTYYACSAAIGGTTYSTQSAATTACTGAGNHPLQFVKVITSATVTPPIHWPGLPASYTLTGSSIMEVQE
jgi:Flp pilus assembly protein TadG